MATVVHKGGSGRGTGKTTGRRKPIRGGHIGGGGKAGKPAQHKKVPGAAHVVHKGGSGHGVAKHPKHPKAKKAPRGLSVGDAQCCVAQALAVSLELAGWPVTDEDVLALHLLIAGPGEYVTIEDGLEAAACYGLAGVRPVHFTTAVPVGPHMELVVGGDAAVGYDGAAIGAHEQPLALNDRLGQVIPEIGHPDSLILGVDDPAPHAVAGDGTGWWSWGERWEPWAEPEEIWAVSWPAR